MRIILIFSKDESSTFTRTIDFVHFHPSWQWPIVTYVPAKLNVHFCSMFKEIPPKGCAGAKQAGGNTPHFYVRALASRIRVSVTLCKIEGSAWGFQVIHRVLSGLLTWRYKKDGNIRNGNLVLPWLLSNYPITCQQVSFAQPPSH